MSRAKTLVSFLFIIIFAVLIGYTGHRLHQLTNISSTNATITRSYLIENVCSTQICNSDFDECYYDDHECDTVTLYYTYDAYDDPKNYYGRAIVQFEYKDQAENFYNTHLNGTEITVFYENDHHNRSYLGNDKDKTQYIITSVLVFLCIGLVCLFCICCFWCCKRSDYSSL